MSDDATEPTDSRDEPSPDSIGEAAEMKQRPRVQPVPPEFDTSRFAPTKPIDELPDTQPDLPAIVESELPPTQEFGGIPAVQPIPPEFAGGQLPEIQEVDPLFIGVSEFYENHGTVSARPDEHAPAPSTQPMPASPSAYAATGAARPSSAIPTHANPPQPARYATQVRGAPPSRGVPAVAVAAVVALLFIAGGAGWWYWKQQTEPDRSATKPTVPSVVVDPGSNQPTVSSTQPPFGSDTTSVVTEPDPTLATPSTSVVATTAAPGPRPIDGDLGLGQAMRQPACDGKFIVITANAVTPGIYEQEVAAAIGRFPGSAYLRTDQTCPSLRPRDDLGNPIYSIYYGAFPTLQEACRIRDQVGGEAYVKILDQTTSADLVQRC